MMTIFIIYATQFLKNGFACLKNLTQTHLKIWNTRGNDGKCG